MKKRINFTGRKKLAFEHIDIRINRPDEQRPASFTAKFHPELWKGLDTNAKVYVEPYAVSSSMRFDFGTVSNLHHPSDTVLSQLDRDDSFLFRIRVVDESGHVGRILADASGIHPTGINDDDTIRKPLFPVHWVDLGELIWRVDYNPHSGPVLQVTTKVTNLPTRLMQEPLLQGSIYPQAFRQVLRILKTENDFDHDADWFKAWHAFVLNLTEIDIEDDSGDDDSDTELFIDNAVQLFSRRHNFGSRARQTEEANNE